MTVEQLIQEMKDIKEANPTLEVSEVLQIFQIQAMKDLTEQIFKLGAKR